jgi:osmoprotectant transport system substrate-binding protein
VIRKIKLAIATVAVAAVGAATLTGCGLEAASQAVPDVKPGSKLADFDSLKGAKIVTTSKDFTEQLVLGKMLSLVLKAKGANVSDQTNAKGSANARQAMTSGAADIMWEYTGTGWVTYLAHSPDPKTGKAAGVEIGDQHAVWAAVKKEDLEKNGIFWGKPAPFNNTYAMAVKESDSKKLGLTKLSQISKLPKDKQTFCLENEFQTRPDGWPGMQSAYGIKNAKATIMDTGIIYNEIGGSNCLLGEVFDTDGRIPAKHLTTLKDDKHYFPIYNPAINIRQEINKKYPQIADMFDKIGQDLSTETMRALNERVDVGGEDPTKVAKDWLTKNGYLKPDNKVVG